MFGHTLAPVASHNSGGDGMDQLTFVSVQCGETGDCRYPIGG
jgi:hypothetical protein